MIQAFRMQLDQRGGGAIAFITVIRKFWAFFSTVYSHGLKIGNFFI